MNLTNLPTAICHVPSPEHDLADHPENTARFAGFEDLLQRFPTGHLHRITPESANDASLHYVHPPAYLAALRQAAQQGPAIIDYAPTYVTPSSYDDALLAAGTVVEVATKVWRREASSGFALIRPPGHHATATQAMGFCLLNNIAIAARQLQALGARRLMIVDIDVHHGNGTQAIFERDPHILYLSTHQAGIYPGTGFLDETGVGDGIGSVVNIPLPPYVGDAGLLACLDQIAAPLAARFAPDALLVSAGFDTHWRDPLANLQLSCSGAYQLIRRLKVLADELCSGRLCLVLEGGYDPTALGGCVEASLSALCGLPAPHDLLGPAPAPEPEISALLERVGSRHRL
jgi:acetoin utilization deacetylase AcuC-like enzyme